MWSLKTIKNRLAVQEMHLKLHLFVYFKLVVQNSCQFSQEVMRRLTDETQQEKSENVLVMAKRTRNRPLKPYADGSQPQVADKSLIFLIGCRSRAITGLE